jgi:hypothetical protein
MHVQKQFEAFQGTTIGLGEFSKSSFSVEDLPSDFLSFMVEAYVIQDVKSVCSESLSKKDTLRMWMFGDGPHENKSHVPLPWHYVGSRIITVYSQGTAVNAVDPELKGRRPEACPRRNSLNNLRGSYLRYNLQNFLS